jgi:hypothetical protein
MSPHRAFLLTTDNIRNAMPAAQLLAGGPDLRGRPDYDYLLLGKPRSLHSSSLHFHH